MEFLLWAFTEHLPCAGHSPGHRGRGEAELRGFQQEDLFSYLGHCGELGWAVSLVAPPPPAPASQKKAFTVISSCHGGILLRFHQEALHTAYLR